MPATILKKERDFLIGADPEFCIHKRRSVISASDVGGSSSTVGADGNGMTFEVRPAPAINPAEVVANIKTALQSVVLLNPELLEAKWSAGSYKYGYPLGGHIHFGTKRAVASRKATALLSQYLGPICLLLEDEKEARNRRLNHSYGRYLDYRVQKHGFEYRTPSSWLVSPEVATGVLSVGKAIIFERLNNKSAVFKDRVTPYYINNCDMGALRTVAGDVMNDITKMALYQKYKSDIDYVFNLVANNKSWRPGRKDMKQCWGISDAAKNLIPSESFVSLWK